MAALVKNREFWDEKAKENAFWFVSSYGSYGDDRNLDEFWASGETILRHVCQLSGYAPSPLHTVVEIGCGIGRITRALAPLVDRVVAFDLSAEMLKLAQQADLQNVAFRLGDGQTLQPVADHSADFVLAYCVFQHLPSHAVLENYLREMVRVAKPDALIAFTTTSRTWKTLFLPALALRRRITEEFNSSGPRGLYKHEWTGIRPSISTTRRLCPIRLSFADMGGERWLFWGRTLAPAKKEHPRVTLTA